MSDPTSDYSEFEAALRDNLGAQEMRIGDVIEGTILAIHGDVALVDVNGKSEAVLDREELEGLGPGDPVEVVVVGMGEELRVSRRLALEARLKEKLSEATASGEPVEGKVVGRRKGGFDITIAGVRGFCPISQIEEGRSDDVDRHLGQTYTFKVLEYDPDARKLVVSRAAHLRQLREAQREAAWAQLEAGATVDGTVRSITDFGAFVDLGGVDGLVHVTELSHARVGHPRDVLSSGETVRVKILDLDRQRDRISLSIKQLQDDPWASAGERFPVRSAVEGTVVRKAAFGAFVELAPGLDGLLHISQLPPGMELAELEVGAPVAGWVRDVDTDNRRLSVTMRRMPERDPWTRIEMRYQEGQTVEGLVENGADFGVFVEVEPGLSALIPVSEMGLGRDVDPRTAFEPGSKLQAKVLSIDPARQRMSLSIKAYKHDLERQEYLQHMGAEATEQQPGVSGFGAQLMAALEKKK